jgi:hypothetical protein
LWREGLVVRLNVSSGISVSTLTFAQNHARAALSHQAQIAMAMVGWQLRIV